MTRRRRFTSRDFLRFAHEQPAECAVCRWTKGERVPAEELHHYGDKGMGQRSDDTWVTPLCMNCHRLYQGKRFLGFLRAGEHEVLAAMQRGNIELLSAYVQQQER